MLPARPWRRALQLPKPRKPAARRRKPHRLPRPPARLHRQLVRPPRRRVRLQARPARPPVLPVLLPDRRARLLVQREPLLALQVAPQGRLPVPRAQQRVRVPPLLARLLPRA